MGEMFPFLGQIFDFVVMFLPHFTIVNTVHRGGKWTRGADFKVLRHDNGMWWPRWLFIPGLFRIWRWHQWDNWWRKTGLHWYWPLVTEEPILIATKRQTAKIPRQKLTTEDDRVVYVRGILIYEIDDVESLLTRCWDHTDTSTDHALVAISQIIWDNPYSHFVAERSKVATSLSRRLRSELKEFGIKVIRLELADFATGRALIHMTDIGREDAILDPPGS